MANAYAVDYDKLNDRTLIAHTVAQRDLFLNIGIISAWINPRSDGENFSGVIFSKGQTSDLQYALYVTGQSGSDMYLNFYNAFASQEGFWRSTNRVIPINTWTHVCVIYSRNSTSNDPTLYVNGSSVAVTETTAPSGSVYTNSLQCVIGNTTTQDGTWDGKLSHISLWKGSITATTLYHGGYAFDLSTLSEYSADCVSWYKHGDGDTFSTSTDTKGLANGTMTSMASDDIVSTGPPYDAGPIIVTVSLITLDLVVPTVSVALQPNIEIDVSPVQLELDVPATSVTLQSPVSDSGKIHKGLKRWSIKL